VTQNELWRGLGRVVARVRKGYRVRVSVRVR